MDYSRYKFIKVEKEGKVAMSLWLETVKEIGGHQLSRRRAGWWLV